MFRSAAYTCFNPRPPRKTGDTLRHGTTDFLELDSDHLRAWDGQRNGRPFYWPGMQRRPGETEFNLDQMLLATYNLVSHHVPEIRHVVYETAAGEFRDTRTGQPYTRRDFEHLSRSPGARSAGAGHSTLQRAALANTVLSKRLAQAEWADLLGKLVEQSNQPANALQGTFYSRTEPRLNAGVSASGIRDIIDPILDSH